MCTNHEQFPTECIPFPDIGIRRASVQSFGFGGTNAHVVLDDAHNYLRLRGLKANHLTQQTSSDPMYTKSSDTIYQTQLLLVWSSPDKVGLQRLTAEYHAHFKEKQAKGGFSGIDLGDIAYTLSKRRTVFPWRTFTVVGVEGSQTFHSKASDPVLSLADRKLGFVFTGQGAQWIGMGRELMTYSAFRDSITRSHGYLIELGCKWSLLSMYLPALTSREKRLIINRFFSRELAFVY